VLGRLRVPSATEPIGAALTEVMHLRDDVVEELVGAIQFHVDAPAIHSHDRDRSPELRHRLENR